MAAEADPPDRVTAVITMEATFTVGTVLDFGPLQSGHVDIVEDSMVVLDVPDLSLQRLNHAASEVHLFKFLCTP